MKIDSQLRSAYRIFSVVILAGLAHFGVVVAETFTNTQGVTNRRRNSLNRFGRCYSEAVCHEAWEGV